MKNLQSLNEWILNENNRTKYSYGCVMLQAPIKEMKDFQLRIEDEDLHEYGKEKDPHVTILYGIHDDETSLDEIKALFSKLGKQEIEISLTEINLFENEEYDVVKINIESVDLHFLNKELRKLPHTSSFPDYKPHMTIAYVKPGTGKKYVEKFEKQLFYKFNRIEYSMADGTKKYFEI